LREEKMVDKDPYRDWIDEEKTAEEITAEIEKIEKMKKKERMVLPVLVIAILLFSFIVIGLYLILTYI
jgi:hypothetical protein